jgi:hypothetical protein
LISGQSGSSHEKHETHSGPKTPVHFESSRFGF